jgi:hypothetical protein
VGTIFSRFWRKHKRGDVVVIVSGLPRSGTSMMMRMLEAGGVPIMTDELRKADEDNPKGYFEVERVKDLDKDTDKAWVAGARGKALKVISFLLKDLPPEQHYRVIFMHRDLDEVIASQKKMLDRRGEASATEDERMKDLYRNHLIKVRLELPSRPNVEFLELHYSRVVDNPRECAEQVRRFLEMPLDVNAMVAAVDKELYRNRKTAGAGMR